jgi:hypothetical protein
MKKILSAITSLIMAAWLAFNPFSKAPTRPDSIGRAFAYTSAVFIVVVGWAALRKNAANDRPDW